MSKRTRNLLILALVLFLCCFGGSLANPFASEDDSANNPIVGFLNKFAGETAVPDEDIQAQPPGCRNGANRFRFAGTCTLNVAAGGTGMRQLILIPDQKLEVTSKVPRKDFAATDKDAAAGQETKIAIDEQGGAVGLRCTLPVPQPCTVTRGDGA
jgi:hypothetical protein